MKKLLISFAIGCALINPAFSEENTKKDGGHWKQVGEVYEKKPSQIKLTHEIKKAKEDLAQAEADGSKEKIANALYSLGTCYQSSKDWDNTAITFQRAIKLYEELNQDDKFLLAASYAGLGDAWVQQGKHEEANQVELKALSLVSSKSPIYPTLNWNLGLSYKALGLYDLSEKHLKIAASHMPDGSELAPDLLYALGTAQVRQGKFSEGLEVFQKVYEFRKIHYGEYDSSTQNAKKAIGEITDLLEKDPKANVKRGWQAFQYGGKYFRDKNDLETAKQYYKKALELSGQLGPDSNERLVSLMDVSAVLVKTKHFDEAKPYIEEGLSKSQKKLGPSHQVTQLFTQMSAIANQGH